MQTRILLDHEKTPDGTAHVVRALLRIDGTAPDPNNRIPLNLCVVLDRSGPCAAPSRSTPSRPPQVID